MKLAVARHYVIQLLIIGGACIALSVLLHVPYIFTLLALSAWALIGHIVTADDDLPGGWSNPDGELPFPWLELTVKVLIFLGLCAALMAFPVLRSFGA